MKPTRTLRLLHVASGCEWRGREMQALSLVEGLAGKGHEPMLAVGAGSPAAERAGRLGLSLTALPAGALARLRRLRSVLAGRAWDVIHLHDTAALRYLALAGAGLTRVPCVLTVRGDIGYGSRVLPRATPIRKVSHFFAVSEWVWSALVRAGIDEERISVIHTGVSLKAFTLDPAETMRLRLSARQMLGLAPQDFVAGSVLHLTEEKGVEILIEAVRRIRVGESPPGEARIKLLIVGEGPHRSRLEEEALRQGMADAVVFTGWREDVPALMAAMDVYVHPAVTGNSFPVALREAMAMAVPVVVTDLMGIREIIDNGKQGLISPVADAEGLARNIMRMRRDQSFARQLGRGGHLKVQRYGTRAMVDRAEELYFRLVR